MALADRSTPNAGTPRPNQAGDQTSRTTTQFDHRAVAHRYQGKRSDFVLVKPWRCADYGRIVHPAETTTLRKLRCLVTRRGFDVVESLRRKSLCFSASCREIMHRWTRSGGRPWCACRRVSPSVTFLTSCSWFAEETYQPSLAPSSWGLVGPDPRTLLHDAGLIGSSGDDATFTAISSRRRHCGCIVKSVGSPASPG